MFSDKITMKPELNSPDLHINPSRFPCMSNTSCTELHQDKKLIFQSITASTIQLIGYLLTQIFQDFYLLCMSTDQYKKHLSAGKIVTKFLLLNFVDQPALSIYLPLTT